MISNSYFINYMEEQKKPEEKKLVTPIVKKADYYTSKKRKVIDFLIGFLVIPGLGALFTYLMPSFGYIILLACLAIFIAMIINGRRFLGMGILVALVAVPLIAFGSCLVLLGR